MTAPAVLGVRPALLLALGLCTGVGACGDVSVDVGSDLDVSLALESSAITAGDSARATVEAVGRDLVDLTVAWADESADSLEVFDAFGAEMLSQRLAHRYTESGTYRIRALVRESSGDTARAVATLQVEAPSAPSGGEGT